MIVINYDYLNSLVSYGKSLISDMPKGDNEELECKLNVILNCINLWYYNPVTHDIYSKQCFRKEDIDLGIKIIKDRFFSNYYTQLCLF